MGGGYQPGEGVRSQGSYLCKSQMCHNIPDGFLTDSFKPEQFMQPLHPCGSANQMFRKCTSKGIGRQGIVLKHRNRLQKEPMPCRPMPLLVQLRMLASVSFALIPFSGCPRRTLSSPLDRRLQGWSSKDERLAVIRGVCDYRLTRVVALVCCRVCVVWCMCVCLIGVCKCGKCHIAHSNVRVLPTGATRSWYARALKVVYTFPLVRDILAQGPC